jgi:hypothetical protein
LSQAQAQTAAAAAITAANLPDATDIETACTAALTAAGLAGLNITRSTLVESVETQVVAGVGGQVIKVYAVILQATSGSPLVTIQSGAPGDTAALAAFPGPMGPDDIAGRPLIFSYAPEPLATLPTGKGLVATEIGMAAEALITVIYSQG